MLKELILTAVLFASTSAWAQSLSLTSPKDVTVLIYYSGDNNLSQFLLSSLKKVQNVGSSEAVNVVIQYDGNKENDSIRMSLNPGAEPTIHKQNVELDSGSVKTLRDFVGWGIQNFPSKKVYLLISGHGRGVLNVPVSDGSDFGNASDILSMASSSDDHAKSYMNEQTIVKGLKSVLGDRKLDLLVYNACLMGNLEVMSMFSSIAQYAVASEYTIYVTLKDSEEVTGRGISLDNIINELNKNPKISERALAHDMMQEFHEAYKDFSFAGGDPDMPTIERYASTLAFYDLTQLPRISAELSKTLNEFKETASKNPSIYSTFLQENLLSSYVDSMGYIDIQDLYRGLAKSINAQTADQKIQEFQKLISEVVLEKVALNVDSPQTLGHLSFFFPAVTKTKDFVDRFNEYYSKIEITQKYGWNGFLDFFWKTSPQYSDDFWIAAVKRWAAGETIYTDSRKDPKFADYYFFLNLDLLPIKWASNGEQTKLKNYIALIETIERRAPELTKHIQYAKSLVKP